MSAPTLTNFFDPTASATATGATKAPPTAFTKKIVVPVLPAEATDDERVSWAFYLALCGTSTAGTLEQWKSYVATYTLATVPSIRGGLTTGVYNFVPLSPVQSASLVQALDRLITDLNASGDTPGIELTTRYYDAITIAGLPAPNRALSLHEVYGEWEPKVLVSHYSIVLFLMGKRVEKDDHTPITVNRPKAIRGKAHLDTICGLLDGALRLSDHSHNLINSAWAESGGLRSACITEMSKYTQSDVDILQDLIYTTLHLLRYNGMNHAKITYAFLQAYPWAWEIPALKGAIISYSNSCKAAVKYPVEIQPYIKLIYADKAPIFPRNEQDPLIACAVDVAMETSSTMDGFYVNPNFGPIVDAFRAERTKRETLRTQELEKKLAEVMMTEKEEVVGGDASEPTN